MTFTDEEIPAELKRDGIKAYCLRCKVNIVLESPRCVTLGKEDEFLAYAGICPGCGKYAYRGRGRKHLVRPPGYYLDRRRAKRLEKRKARLLDRVPTIRAAYVTDDKSD